jgi:hypothetical protein
VRPCRGGLGDHAKGGAKICHYVSEVRLEDSASLQSKDRGSPGGECGVERRGGGPANFCSENDLSGDPRTPASDTICHNPVRAIRGRAANRSVQLPFEMTNSRVGGVRAAASGINIGSHEGREY